MSDLKRFYLPCECGSPEHLILIEEASKINDKVESVIVYIVSTIYRSFWQRLKFGLKYIFKKEELVLGDVVIDIEVLKNVLNKIEK